MSSSLLLNLTKCFDGRSVNDVEPSNDNNAGKLQHSPGSTSKQLNISNNGASSSNSNRTDPTAPITASTKSSLQKQLALKTGMSTSTPRSNRDAVGGAATGSGAANSNGSSADSFWNFNVRSADSNHSDSEGAARHDHDVNVTNDSDLNASFQSGHTSNSQSNNTSPTSLLLTRSAEAAAEAAQSLLTKMEAISNYSFKGLERFNLAAVPFCGSTHNVRVIPEEEDDAGDARLNYRLCSSDNHCFPELDRTAFQGNGRGEEEQGIRDNESPNNTTTQETRGYEIRLKSTFSQLQIKNQRQQQKQSIHTNNPNDDSSSLPASSRAAPLLPPSAFGRTHPDKKSATATITPTQPRKAPDTSSRSLPPSSQSLPFEYLSVPLDLKSKSVPSSNDKSIADAIDAPGPIQPTASDVSELTMRSHGERYQRYASDSRRMAYYAVGKANEGEVGGGGNRRCYFTGSGIRYGVPFYAGSVQQGPR